tara:strand:- start:224 stop:1420 length:1197 start_codon:yes stop_codon:yes gene_type:complete
MARNLRVGVQRGLRQSIAGGFGTGDIFTLSPASFDFGRTKTSDSRITFTRASSGTFVDADGLIKSAATNTPRFDHDLVTGKSLGLLIEGSRTNLVTYSEQLDQWTLGSHTTVTANAATAPDGTNTADLCVFNARNGTYIISNNSLISGRTYTASVWAKAVTPGTDNKFTFNMGGHSNASSQFTTTDQWQRFTFTHTPSFSGGPSGLIINNEGDAFRTEVYFWGAQVEEASYATSYIPTTSSQVTRAADVAEITGTDFSSFYSEAKGSIFVQASGATLTPDSLSVNIQNEAGNSRHTFNHRTGKVKTIVGGVGQVNLSTGAPSSIGDVVKVAYAYEVNNFAACKNGGSIVSDTSGNVPTTNEMQFGNNSPGTKPLNGHIKRLIYFPMRLADGILQSITS